MFDPKPYVDRVNKLIADLEAECGVHPATEGGRVQVGGVARVGPLHEAIDRLQRLPELLAAVPEALAKDAEEKQLAALRDKMIAGGAKGL